MGEAVLSRLVWCLACAAVACGEDVQPTPVTVDGFSLTPDKDRFVAADGRFVVHPAVLAGVAYDDNVLATDPAHGDFYARLSAALAARDRFDETSSLAAFAELDVLRYHSSHQLDLIGGQASLAYAHHDLVVSEDANAGFSRAQQVLFDTGEQLAVDTYHVGANGSYLGRYESLGAELAADRVRYRQDSRLFTAAQADHDDYSAGARYGWEYERDAGIFAHVVGSRTHYETNELYNDSYGVALRLGWHSAPSERTTLSAEAGVEYRRYQVVDENPPFDRRDAVAPSLLVDLEWPWGEAESLGFKAFSDIRDAATSNAAWTYGATASARHQLVRLVDLVGSLGFTEQRDLNAPSGSERGIRNEGAATVGAEARWRAGLGLRLTVSYVDSRANVGGSYQRVIAGIDMAVVY
jgi:hypothetical protein